MFLAWLADPHTAPQQLKLPFYNKYNVATDGAICDIDIDIWREKTE